MRYPDWQELYPELLAAIARLLTSSLDYMSFRGVCKSWKFAATFDNFDREFPRVPWLILELKKKHQLRTTPVSLKYVTKFLDMSNNKIFRIADLQQEDVQKYYLSCNGWILCVAKGSPHIHLTHPIRCNRIKLPDLDTLPGFRYSKYARFIDKMVLSGSPTDAKSDFVIMVIWGGCHQLGFSRPGDSAWTVMQYQDASFRDILYHKKKLYAIDVNYRVVEYDIHGPNPTRMHLISRLYNFDKYPLFMVESSGKFLIVPARGYGQDFRVIEFDFITGSYKEIFDLGNKALFLSHSSSFCLEGFAWNDEVQPNCLYIAKPDLCFNLVKKTKKRFLGQIADDLLTEPTWVVPGI